MAPAQRPVDKPRPVYLNLFAIRQPVPAVVSFLHRVSGTLLFLAGLPLLLWVLDTSLATPQGYERVGKTLDSTATLRPARASCSDARMPEPPAPTISAS
jgi:hypothetical protein